VDATRRWKNVPSDPAGKRLYASTYTATAPLLPCLYVHRNSGLSTQDFWNSGPQCATRVPVCCVTPVRISLHCIAPHCSKSSGNSNHGVRISSSKNMVRYYISLEIIYSANENAMRLLYLNEIYKKLGVHTTAPHPYTKGTTTPVPEIGKQTRFINGPVAESQLGSCLCTRDKKGDHANAVVC
jgi:hypothetical protein